MKKLFVICALSALSTIVQGAAVSESVLYSDKGIERAKIIIAGNISKILYNVFHHYDMKLENQFRNSLNINLREARAMGDVQAQQWVIITLSAFDGNILNASRLNTSVKPALLNAGFPASRYKVIP